MICPVSHRQIRSLTCPDSHSWSRCFSSAKSTTVAAKRGSGERGTLPKPWGIERPHIAGVPTPRPGGARGAAACLDQLGLRLGWAVRKRAVVQWFSWGHWLRVSRKVLTRCRTAGRCVLMPRLSSVLKSVPNAQRPERSIKPAEVAPATPLRPGCATEDTDLAIEPTQLSHTVFKQHLISVFSPRTTSRRPIGVGNWATLRTAKVFPGLPGLMFRPPGVLHCWRWQGW